MSVAVAATQLADLIRRDPAIIQRERAKRRFGAFVDRMYPTFMHAAHITELHTALVETVNTPGGRLIVTMPPRHSKSINVSEHLPAWYLGNHPDERVILAAHTASLAYTFSRRVRNKFADPRWPFPHVRVADDKGAVGAWDIAGRLGGLLAVGVGGSPTGQGGNGIIIDDPIRSQQDAMSQTVRDALWEWYQGTLYTRLEPDGWIIVTNTRWHDDDLTGRLLAEQERGGEQWRHIHMPAISDAGEPLWPERWPLPALERIRRAVGSRVFEAQYQGRPTADEGGMFKRHWWRFWQPSGANLPSVPVRMPDGSTKRIEPRDKPAYWDNAAQSWDMTFKKTESGSYVVGLVGERTDANAYITDCFRDRVEFTGAVEAVRSMTARHPEIDAKLIEDKANGPAIIDTLSGSVPGIIAVDTDGSKEARAQSSTARVEAGNWYLPHPEIAPWVEDFIGELAAFPTGKHDDQVDAFTQLDRYFYSGGDYSELDAYMARQLGRV